MAKNVLPVDFQDDILAESMNGRRKYQMITNSDGTVSFVDVTEYTQVGSNFGQAQVNATNEAVNESADKNKIIDDKDDLMANSQAGMIAWALAVKAIREELYQNMSKFIPFAFSQNVTFSDGKIKLPGPAGKIITSAYLTVTFPMSTEIMSAIVSIENNQIEITGYKNAAALNQVVWVNIVGFLIVS